MKKENNLELKTRFFALYWGQMIFSHHHGEGGNCVTAFFAYKENKEGFLELTPLSKISDEDALVVYRFHYPLDKWDDKEERDSYDTKEAVEWLHNLGKPNYIKLTCEGADYLRSKGYALPFLNISVNEQIELGWIKLKEEK
jgi:protein tyrosine phosphatase